MFPINNGLKKGDALPPLLLIFALGYATFWVQVNQDGLKLNGAHQLLVYADDVNILGGRVHTVKKNTEALIVASKETGLELNAGKSKSMIVSRDQTAERCQSIKNDNRTFERAEEFIYTYLGKTLTNQNSIQEEIKIR